MRSTEAESLKLAVVRPTMGQGGADRVTLNLLRGLDQGRFDVTLVLGRAEGAFMDDIPGHVRVVSLDVGNVWRAWIPLARCLKALDPDIVLSTSSGTNVVAIVARSISKQSYRLVLSERNVLYHGGKTFKRRVIVRLKKLLYSRADQITAVSQGVKDDLVRLGIPADRIQVVYNPVVTPDLPSLVLEDVDHPWFGDGVPVVLAAGRLVPEKGFETLVEAFALLRHRRTARLVILGEGPLEKHLRAKVNEKGLAESVWFAGFDKNPFRYMARCSVFVLASRDEGLPGVLVQAMACGAAVVSTDCHAGPSEIITHGVDGWLVPVGEPGALAERIAFCLENPEATMEMAQNARLAADRFKVEAVLPNYVSALMGSNAERMDRWNAQLA
jgi:glycosyltransferase involved in cell wall biosynthesis